MGLEKSSLRDMEHNTISEFKTGILLHILRLHGLLLECTAHVTKEPSYSKFSETENIQHQAHTSPSLIGVCL
jgi:hypothetical protein